MPHDLPFLESRGNSGSFLKRQSTLGRRDPGVHFGSQLTSQETMFLVLTLNKALAVLVACSFFEHVEHFAPRYPFSVLHISHFLEALLMMTLHCLNPLNHHKFVFQKIPAQLY